MIARAPSHPQSLNLLFLFLAVSLGSARPAQQPPDAIVRNALESAAAALETGDDTGTLQALLPVDAVEPSNPWLWFYRGRAHNMRGYPHEAIAAFDRALNTLAVLGDPDPEFAARVRSDRRRVRRQVVNVSLQLGLAYDTNVTFRGGGTTGPLISGRGDGKFASQFRWEYAPVATPEEAVTLGGRLAHAWHFAIDEFNYQDYAAFVRYTRPLDDGWTLNGQYDYDLTYLGNQPFLSNHALTLSLRYHRQPTGRRWELGETRFDYRIDARDFLIDTAPEFDRDGYANSFEIGQTFRLRLNGDASRVLDLYAGYRLQNVATEGSEFDRVTNGFYVRVAMPLRIPWMPDKDAVLGLSASWEIDDYRNRSLLDLRGRRREDVITSLGLVLSQPLRIDPDRGDLILHAIVNWTDSDSNVRGANRDSPFNYDKVVAGLQLEWRF